MQSPGLVRVNTDGSQDTSFAVGNGVAPGEFRADGLDLQPDGQIIVGGNFTRFNNAAAPGIVRLNADGSIDTTFNAGAGAAGRTDVVYAASCSRTARYVVGGDFATFNGVTTDGIVRLNADGYRGQHVQHERRRGQFVRLRAGGARDGGILLGREFHDGRRFRLAGRGAARRHRRERERGRGDDQREPAEDRLRPEQQHVALVTLTRTGNLSQVALEVFYTFAGAAVSGVDYLSRLSGHRTIKAGAASVSFSVVAIAPADPTYTVLPVKLVLIAGTGYTVGSVPPFVKIKIVH